MFNANADTAKPLIPTAAFGTSAPPPGASKRNVSGGGLIGNRLPKLDPSGAGVIGRNVAQPVGRKVSESRGLVGNRIPRVEKHHTGGSTGSAGSSGRAEKEQSGEKGAQPEEGMNVPPPPLQAKDLEEDAVDLSASTATVGESKGFSDMKDDDLPETAKPGVPEIRAEDLVPSTLPHDENADIDSDASQPPSPRSTAATASTTSPALTAFSETSSSVPGLNRVMSTLSLATQKSSASRVTQASSLRVETGADDDVGGKVGEGDAGGQDEQEKRRLEEDQDNMSDVSTPTGTPTMPAREYLPEIPGTSSHPIGGLSLHADGHVSPGAFGSARGMPNIDHHDKDITVDTSAIPDEQQKLRHEGKVVEQKPDATETEKNRKGNEAKSQGDFKVTDDKMVNIELPEDDPALTEEGRKLQRLAKEKLAKAAKEQGKSEWEVLDDDSENRPETVKGAQASANEKETGDPGLSFTTVHEEQRQEAEEKAERAQEKRNTNAVPSQDFAKAEVSEPPSAEPKATKATMPSDGDKGEEPESPMSNETREHAFMQGDSQNVQDVTAETVHGGEGVETPAEVVEPPTPAPEVNVSEEATADDAETVEEEGSLSDVADIVDVQDIEDIPTGDDTEMHKKDQDPNVESLIVGKSDDGPGVKPEVNITEHDSTEPAPATAKAPERPAATPDVEEPDSASFPSVPQQDPQSATSDRNAIEVSRTPTPAPEGVKLPSVPKDDVDQEDSPQGKVRVGVALSPGKHLRQQSSEKTPGRQIDEDVKRFEAKKDGPSASDVPTENTAASIDAMAATLSDPARSSGLAKSTSSSSTLSSSSSSRKRAQGSRSPLLDMDPDGEDGGETGWAKVSVNKTKYS
ncbi:hypothetical protein NCC49_001813 [Naganishia albida]|nr:hypothetical protein NCC49_001813 [Naganishia albida]